MKNKNKNYRNKNGTYLLLSNLKKKKNANVRHYRLLRVKSNLRGYTPIAIGTNEKVVQ